MIPQTAAACRPFHNVCIIDSPSRYVAKKGTSTTHILEAEC